MAKVKGLTAKQKKFCESYAVLVDDKLCKNPVGQAAINAGYSPKTANSMGSENLTKPELIAYIDVQKKILRKRAEMSAEACRITPEYVLAGIASIAEKPNAKDSDRLRAYELLGRTIAMFTDRQEIKGDIDNHITIKFDSPEDGGLLE
jgi:phage terminase small subunit